MRPKRRALLCVKPGRLFSDASPPRDRDGEHSPAIDFHRAFLETRRSHQLINLRRGAPAHDPSLALAIAQDARDEFQLRMPGLVGVNQVAAGLERFGQSA